MQAEDEEALREEEEEALAIQRKAAEELGDQDLGAESSSGEETEGDFEADQQVGLTWGIFYPTEKEGNKTSSIAELLFFERAFIGAIS